MNAENEERPVYSSMSKLANGVEIRDYLPTVWACTSSSAVRMIQDTTMFFNLFYYIQGKNDQNQKVLFYFVNILVSKYYVSVIFLTTWYN